jgi:hypothetical protein
MIGAIRTDDPASCVELRGQQFVAVTRVSRDCHVREEIRCPRARAVASWVVESAHGDSHATAVVHDRRPGLRQRHDPPQRLSAPALGFTANSDGFNAVLLIWWLIGGIVFLVGLVLTAVTGAGNHYDQATGGNKGRSSDRRWPT